jgi:hypothetical protein
MYETIMNTMMAGSGTLSVQKCMMTLKAVTSKGIIMVWKTKKLIPAQNPMAGSTNWSANLPWMKWSGEN